MRNAIQQKNNYIVKFIIIYLLRKSIKLLKTSKIIFIIILDLNKKKSILW